MPETHKSASLGAGLIVVSSFFYASYGIWIKLTGDFFTGFTATIFRSLFVVVLLLPYAALRRHFQPVDFRRNWAALLALCLSATVVWGPLYYAVLHAGIGVSMTINYATSVIGMFLFGRLLAGEKITKDKLIAAVVGFAGLWLVFAPSTSGVGALPLLAAVLGGTEVALNTVVAKKLPYNATQSTLSMWLMSIIASLAMAFALRAPVPSVGLHVEWLYLFVFATASVIASTCFIAGIKMMDVGVAGILGLLEVAFAVLFGVLFFDEHIDFPVLVGIVLIIIAGAIPYTPVITRVEAAERNVG